MPNRNTAEQATASGSNSAEDEGSEQSAEPEKMSDADWKEAVSQLAEALREADRNDASSVAKAQLTWTDEVLSELHHDYFGSRVSEDADQNSDQPVSDKTDDGDSEE